MPGVTPQWFGLDGSDDPCLMPLLACLIEPIPWLKQWHNDIDPEFGIHMGGDFEGFIQEEARHMGKTSDEIRAWEPPRAVARRRRHESLGQKHVTRDHGRIVARDDALINDRYGILGVSLKR